MGQPLASYRICIDGPLDATWPDWFGDCATCHAVNDHTVITTAPIEPPRLLEILAILVTWMAPVIAIRRVPAGPAGAPSRQLLQAAHAALAAAQDMTRRGQLAPEDVRVIEGLIRVAVAHLHALRQHLQGDRAR